MDELQTSGKEHLRRDRLLKLMQQDSSDLELMVGSAGGARGNGSPPVQLPRVCTDCVLPHVFVRSRT